MLPAHLPVLGEIALRTAAIYMVVLLGVRLSGKREVGQMTPFDLTLLLLISNSVQNAMTGPDTSVTGGMAAAVTLLLMNYLVAELSGTNRRFRKIIQGEPTLLVHDGQLLPAHLSWNGHCASTGSTPTTILRSQCSKWMDQSAA
jgi:uncharacterized membrane protein YcaP (DUF421 family)